MGEASGALLLTLGGARSSRFVYCVLKGFSGPTQAARKPAQAHASPDQPPHPAFSPLSHSCPGEVQPGFFALHRQVSFVPRMSGRHDSRPVNSSLAVVIMRGEPMGNLCSSGACPQCAISTLKFDAGDLVRCPPGVVRDPSYHDDPSISPATPFSATVQCSC